jgi:DNA-binding MarR family transcriptional regulator
MSAKTGAASAYPTSYGIFQLARTHRAYAAELLRVLDLHPGQELLIMALWEHGPQTQSQLVKIERLEHSTIAKSLSRMERAGLINRRQSKEHRRATIVSLTAKGRALHKKIDAVWSELERVSVASLDDDQRERLLHAMQTVEESIALLSKGT